jgi:hypothetical protein
MCCNYSALNSKGFPEGGQPSPIWKFYFHSNVALQYSEFELLNSVSLTTGASSYTHLGDNLHYLQLVCTNSS